MLQQMRRAQSWMIKGVLWAVVLAFVVTIFYAWGVRSGSGPTRTEVATILGERIDIPTFQREQNDLFRYYQRLFGNRSDIDLRQQFPFREMALERLATNILLRRLAHAEGLSVTDKELYAHIADLPAFQDQGRFDPSRYQATLRNQVPPVAPRQFEEEQRQALLRQKIYMLVRASAQVTEAEVEQAYRRDHERVAVRYATLVPGLFRDQVTATDDEVRAHYEAQPGAYRAPEERRLRYAVMTPQRFSPQGEVPRQDIEDYYASYQEDFLRPEQVRVRHILFRLAENAPEELVADVRARAQHVLTAVQAGADFATQAQERSEDPVSAAKGGDLGFFPRGQMVPAFEEAAFALPVGQLSDLVRTPFGLHILRVEERVEAGVKPLAEVLPEISARIRHDRARDAMLTFVDEFMAVMEDDPNQFATLAEQHGLQVVETPFLPATGTIADLEGDPGLVRRAFALSEQMVEAVGGSDDRYFFVQVAEVRPASIPAFEAVETRVRNDVLQRKSADLARQRAEEWVAQIKTGTSLAQLVASLPVQIVDTEAFTRSGSIPQLGQNATFSRVAFELQVGEAGAAHDGERHFVIQVTARHAADMEKYAQNKASYRTAQRDRKQQRLLQAFQHALQSQYQQLRQQGDIIVNPQYVF